MPKSGTPVVVNAVDIVGRLVVIGSVAYQIITHAHAGVLCARSGSLLHNLCHLRLWLSTISSTTSRWLLAPFMRVASARNTDAPRALGRERCLTRTLRLRHPPLNLVCDRIEVVDYA